MKIGISTCGADGGKSGISRYTISLIREFAAMETGHEFEVMAYADELDIFVPGGSRIGAVSLAPELRGIRPNLLWHVAALGRLCARRGYDVLFLPAGNRRLPWLCPCPTVGTVHDFSILHVPGKYDAVRDLYIRRALPALCRRLTRAITVSECSKRDVVAHARVPEDRIVVIPEAADAEVYTPGDRPAAQAATAERFGLAGPYLLYISRIEHPGKNHVRLIEAFAQLKAAGSLPNHTLALAGSDWSGAEAVHRAAEASGCSGSIRFLGFVPDAAVPDLYRGADLFVFPSLYEGFGLPLLESMGCGTPVACSRASSLPEVGGDAVVMFNPEDTIGMAEAIRGVAESPARQAELRAAGLHRAGQFSWRRAATATLAVLEDAAGRR